MSLPEEIRAGVHAGPAGLTVSVWRIGEGAPPLPEEVAARYCGCLRETYEPYFGDGFHLKALTFRPGVLLMAEDGARTVAASVVKTNGRRSSMGVAEGYRRQGLASLLTECSLQYVPFQFSISARANRSVFDLYDKLGFRLAQSAEEVRDLCDEEWQFLSDFRMADGVVTFSRRSTMRGATREGLVFWHRGNRPHSRGAASSDGA